MQTQKFIASDIPSIVAGLAELDSKMIAGLVLGKKQWMDIS